MPSTASNGTVVGVFSGTSLGAAFTNPQSLDILQVINEGGTVVWNMTSAGVTNTNPASPTATALYQRVFGATLAVAWENLSQLDLLQVVNPSGQSVVFHVDYLGTAYTP